MNSSPTVSAVPVTGSVKCRLCGVPLPESIKIIGVCVWCVKKENDRPTVTVKKPYYGR